MNMEHPQITEEHAEIIGNTARASIDYMKILKENGYIKQSPLEHAREIWEHFITDKMSYVQVMREIGRMHDLYEEAISELKGENNE